MPGKTPKNSGDEPFENGVRSNGDVEMKDSGKTKGRNGAKDAEDEMTVVVPPSKSTKQSSKQPHDADGDVAMGEEDKADDGEVKVDPVAQTVAGKYETTWTANAHYPHLSRWRCLCSPSFVMINVGNGC